MATTDAHEQRCFAIRDKFDAVTNRNLLQRKFVGRLLCDPAQLMLRHRAMRLVLDPADFTTVFTPAHHAPEVHDSTRFVRKTLRRRRDRSLSQRDVTKGLYHLG